MYIYNTFHLYIYMYGYISCNLCLFELKWRIVASLLRSMDVHLQSYWQGWVLWPKMEWIQELASDFGDLGLSSFRDMWVCPKIGYIPNPKIGYIPKCAVWGESLFTFFGSPILQLFAPLKIQSLLRPAKKMVELSSKKTAKLWCLKGNWFIIIPKRVPTFIEKQRDFSSYSSKHLLKEV